MAAGAATQDTAVGVLGQTHWPASQMRTSLQSLSDAQPTGDGTWAAQPATPMMTSPSGHRGRRWGLIRRPTTFKREC
jgi:hypothetical protein